MRFTLHTASSVRFFTPILGTRRLSIDQRVAQTLELLHVDNPAAPLAEIATHWLAAGPAFAVKARDTARRAAERARLQR